MIELYYMKMAAYPALYIAGMMIVLVGVFWLAAELVSRERYILGIIVSMSLTFLFPFLCFYGITLLNR